MEKKRLIFSTNGLNRYKGRVLSSGCKLEDYLKNPVLLFGHQSWSLPIGRLEDIRTEANGDMTALPVFDEQDEFALAVKNKWENNFLFAASIHYNPLSFSDDPALILPGQESLTVTQWDLMEVSIVSVPGNGGSATGLQLDAFSKSTVPHITKIQNMDFKKIALTLGLPEGADESAVLAGIEALKGQNQNLLSANIDTVMAIGRAKGVVTDANEATFKKLAATDLSSVKQIFEVSAGENREEPKPTNTPAAPTGQLLSGMLNGGAPKTTPPPGSDGREEWSFDDWSNKDQKGLLAMKAADPVRYQQLAAKRLEQMS